MNSEKNQISILLDDPDFTEDVSYVNRTEFYFYIEDRLALLSRIVHGLVCLLAIPVNLVVLVRTFRERSQTLHWKPQDNLIFNMALGDTLYSCATLFMSLKYPDSGDFCCTTMGYTAYVSGNTGLIIPALLAVNRYSVLRMGQRATNERLASIHDNFTALLSGGVWLWCAIMMFPFIATGNVGRNLLGGMCGVKIISHNLWVYWVLMGSTQMLICYPMLLVTSFKLVRLFQKHGLSGPLKTAWVKGLRWMNYVMAAHALAVPVIQAPVFVVKALEFHLTIPKWVGHVVFLPYSFNSLINPLLILFLVKQYRDFSFLKISRLSQSRQATWRRSPKQATPKNQSRPQGSNQGSPPLAPCPVARLSTPTPMGTPHTRRAFSPTLSPHLLSAQMSLKRTSSNNLLTVPCETEFSPPQVYINVDVDLEEPSPPPVFAFPSPEGSVFPSLGTSFDSGILYSPTPMSDQYYNHVDQAARTRASLQYDSRGMNVCFHCHSPLPVTFRRGCYSVSRNISSRVSLNPPPSKEEMKEKREERSQQRRNTVY